MVGIVASEEEKIPSYAGTPEGLGTIGI